MTKNAEMQLDRALSFTHEDYRFSKRDGLRINATIQKLLNNSEITKDAVREAQSITCQMVTRFTTAVLSDAIRNSTKSGDSMIAGTFDLVLQAVLVAKTGGMKKSSHYTGNQYIKWKDLKLLASIDNGKVVLEMLVKLLFRKGHKSVIPYIRSIKLIADHIHSLRRDSTKVQSVELGQLSDGDSVVAPTKLCVAFALRIGAVKETSWPGLIATFSAVQASAVYGPNLTHPSFTPSHAGNTLTFQTRRL